MKSYDVMMGAINDCGHTLLSYQPSKLSAKQKRFEGRHGLYPDLDFRLFTCRAVVDWIEVQIELQKPTQGIWINARLKRATGCNCYAKRKADTTFTVRFQQPDFTVVNRAIDFLEQRYGLATGAMIASLEVSVDFKPKHQGSELLRRQLVGVLWRHLSPHRNLFKEGRDMPRFVWGHRAAFVAGIHPRRRNSDPIPELLLVNGEDIRPYADATVYFGARGAPSSWRVMDKILDQQNPRTGTKLELSATQRRVRVEVTLGSDQLEAIGVRWLDDLRTFNFCELAHDYFRFVVPTFVDSDQIVGMRRRLLLGAWEQERTAKFLNTGVVGLEAMDRHWETLRRRGRRELFKDMAKRGLQPKHQRTGSTFMAFTDLNKRIDMALRKLTERIERQFLPPAP
ncbi:hypothetical protein AU467_25320 [Mesorhizobium loti]|uniref:Replication protein n=1 Tax=Rhizobium loti TaxID=381 RepID=A0A117N2V8_RHILI|nr:hypothetical protein AU467_25320 [Mesorhizobium loti]